MIKIICILLAGVCIMAAPSADLMSVVPGFTDSFTSRVYSGYLKTENLNRELHYIFVESVKGVSNNDPVTLWLNGGPGCSSLLGFIQQIGPFFIEDGVDYKKGDKLTENPSSWHKASNLLFIESPAGVGFSYNLDKSYKNNDNNTAYDSLAALKDFFTKFPQYRKTGQSYAGKYIPDLAVLIDKYNIQASQTNKINLIAILVGNGVMSFKTLDQSQIQFNIDRSFVSPQLVPLYYKDCKENPSSDLCRYFKKQYNKALQDINPYNVYGYCFYDDSPIQQKRKRISQDMVLNRIIKELSPSYQSESVSLSTAPCAYDDGLYNYFNIHEEEYHAKFAKMEWKGPCTDISYRIDPAGSIQAYQYLLRQKKYTIVLYNGDWDGVVPFLDTIKGMEILDLKPISERLPWFTDRQHSGFSQLYNGVLFATIKGAAHEAPQTKRPESYNLFTQILNSKGTILGHNINNQKNIQTQ